MRPAQKAPENPFCFAPFRLPSRRFNEAGAKSAGKRLRVSFDAANPDASMRPAQKAPENY